VVQSIVMSMFVCLFVCVSGCLSLCPLIWLENYIAKFHLISMHVACGSGSVLLWRRCDTLCTSGLA